MYIIGLNKYFVSQFLMCLKIWNFKFNLCKWRSYPNCVQCIIFGWNFNDTKSKLKNFNSSDCRAIDIKIRFMITFLPNFNDDRVYIENNWALKVHTHICNESLIHQQNYISIINPKYGCDAIWLDVNYSCNRFLFFELTLYIFREDVRN